MMDFHMLSGVACTAGGLFASGFYVRATLRGETKPHAFSWLIWGLLTSLGGVLAFFGGATISAVVQGIGGIVNLSICCLAIKVGRETATRNDWVTLIAALSIIPVWVTTKEPLAAAVLVSAIDILGSFPTFRKAWDRPQEENGRVFGVYTLTSTFSVLAITPLTFVTGLYPITGMTLNIGTVLIIVLRRRALLRMQNA